MAAKPWLEPRSASLQSPNSVHKSCQLPGHLGFTERSLGMGLLIFGSDEGFNKLQDVYVTNGLLFLSGGISFGRTKGTSGSEADDETQLTFYTEQYRSRRRSKGKGGLGKVPQPAFVGGKPGSPTRCSITNLNFSSTWSRCG